MPKSNWIFAVAFGLILIGSEGRSQSATEDQPRQEESTANTDQDGNSQQSQANALLPALEDIEAAIRDLITEEDQISADTQQDRESRDLEAQEGMAFWAEWMFYAACATVALTLAALMAIIRTLYHTKIAAQQSVIMAEQAGLATHAAQESVSITKQMGEAQVRAYLTIGSARVHYSPDERPPLITLTVRNSGQSPAYSVRAIFRVHTSIGKNSFSLVGDASGRKYEIANMIGAGADQVFNIDTKAVFSDSDEDTRIIFECVLQYQTIFTRGTNTFDVDTRFRAIHFREDDEAREESVQMDILTTHNGAWFEAYAKEHSQWG